MKGRIAYEVCPLCEGEHRALREVECREHELWKPVIDEVMRWRQCTRCGHVFTEGHFTDEASAAIFADVNPCQEVAHDFEGQRPIAARLVDYVGDVYCAKWLDVGFGSGALMFAAAEYGARVAGIDLRAENVELMRKLGFDVACQPLQALGGKFDVISMCDVLEHMPDPKAGLIHARQLCPNGRLLVSCPNMGSTAAKLLTASDVNPYWREIEHFHNFTRERLYALLAECGWEPVRYRVSERYRLGMEVLCT